MITGELRNKIDGICNILWSNGMPNPLDSTEQITYLLFIKEMYPEDWQKLVEINDEDMLHNCFKEIFEKMKEVPFMNEAIFKISNPTIFKKTFEGIKEIANISDERGIDIKGDVYEYLLSQMATAGINGQFRTPSHIIKMIVELMNPQKEDIICDPACGSGGFLVNAIKHLNGEVNGDNILGYDIDRTMIRLASMNLIEHGIKSPKIKYKNSIQDNEIESEIVDLILANPPFKGSVEDNNLGIKSKKAELLFLHMFLRIMKIGGKCACIIPDGVLFGSSNAHKDIRKKIIEENKLIAMISLPSGVFKPYAGVSTGILIFEKTNHGRTDEVWFHDMKADGYSLDDKRNEIKDNDIPDIIARFKNLENEKGRQRTEQSFLVPKEEIVENGYDLSINKYKKTEYIQVKYPPTKEILTDLKRINNEIATELLELEEMLKEER